MPAVAYFTVEMSCQHWRPSKPNHRCDMPAPRADVNCCRTGSPGHRAGLIKVKSKPGVRGYGG
jgi:hypothetical protein